MPGLIPQAFLDNLLDRVDIVEVIDRRVKLKKTGKNYAARCPFHDEKTPSFSVNPEKQFYYCFGCGAGGNAIGFVMEYDNVEFPQAVETLASGMGLEVPREQSRGPDGKPAPTAEQVSENKALYEILEKASRFYQQQLRQHPDRERAVAYLKGRGLSGEIAKQFHIGLAPAGWDNLLSALADNDEQRALLIKAGLVVVNEKGRTYDRFRDRIVFPIRDRRGRVIAFGGRVLGDDKPKYLNSPETTVFQKGRELYGLFEARQNNRHLQRVLVVEGYMDVIALAQHGITYATATLGTATSRTHLENLFRLCPRIVFCFDGDEAGRKAALRALEAALPCMEDGRQAGFLFLQEGKDPDDTVRAEGREHFEALLDSADSLETFLFDSVAAGIDLDSLDGRARMGKLALPYLRALPEGIFRQLMFQALAERTGLELSSLMALEAPALQPRQDAAPEPDEATDEPPEPDPGQFPDDFGAASSAPEQPVARPPSGFSNHAQAAIALLLHQPDIARLVEPHTLSEVHGEDGTLLRELLDLLHKRPDCSTAMLLGHWYGTPEGDLLNRLAGQERLIPTTGIEGEFLDVIQGLTQDLPQQSKLAAQVDKFRSTNYADVSDLEKEKLREMLREKALRDARRNKPGL